MIRSRFAVLPAVLTALLALTLSAQERGRPEGGSGTSAPSGGGGASIANRGAAVGDTSPSPSVSTSAPRGFASPSSSIASPGFYGGTVTGSRTYYQPNLEHTSFYSMSTYYEWQQFMFRLQTSYYLNNSYFRRFYRNQEPLVTPQLVKLTTRAPLALSLRMVGAIEELDALLTDSRNGTPVDKKAISNKTKEIRDIASKIRKDDTLAFIDRGADRDVTKDLDKGTPSPELMGRLREMAIDLHTQLKNLYMSTSTSTVSVDSLTQPSFASLSKGIERMARAVENSSNKL